MEKNGMSIEHIFGVALHRGSIHSFHPAARGFDSQRSRKKCFKVSEIFRRHWFEESGQKLDNVNRTHLVLASATKSK